MSFVTRLRSLRRNRRPVEYALAAAATATLRDEIVSAALQRAGNPPRI